MAQSDRSYIKKFQPSYFNSPWGSKQTDLWNENFAKGSSFGEDIDMDFSGINNYINAHRKSKGLQAFDFGDDAAANLTESLFRGVVANIPVVGEFLGGFFEELFPSEEKQFQDEIMKRRREQAEKFGRWQIGDFSEQERADIERANEPLFDAIYGQMAARGIESSGMGQEQLNRAYQEVFFEQQRQAANMLMGMDEGSLKMLSQISADDPSFFSDIREGFSNLAAAGTIEEFAGVGNEELLNQLDGLKGGLNELNSIMEMFKTQYGLPKANETK